MVHNTVKQKNRNGEKSAWLAPPKQIFLLGSSAAAKKLAVGDSNVREAEGLMVEEKSGKCVKMKIPQSSRLRGIVMSIVGFNLV